MVLMHQEMVCYFPTSLICLLESTFLYRHEMLAPVGREQVQFVWRVLEFSRAFLEVPSRITT